MLPIRPPCILIVCFPRTGEPTILKWRILSATNDLDRVSAVALPKLPISLTNTDLKVASDTQFYPGLGTVSQGSWGSEGGVHCGLGL